MDSGKTRSRPRTSLLLLAALLGAMFGLVCVALIWVISHRDPLPPISAQDFHEAQRRWREHGPDDYDIQIEVSGRQPAVYRVEVRGGEPTAAYRNGRLLPQQRTWETWTVPGMFNTLASDFENVARRQGGQAGDATPRLALFGIFHPQYGYPQRYRRIAWGQGRETSMAHRIGQQGAAVSQGAPLETSWVVREFTVRPDR